HAANRLRPIEGTAGAAEDLDAVEILGSQIRDVECARGSRVDLDPVDQDKRLRWRRAANRYVAFSPRRATLGHGYSRNLLQGGGDALNLLRLHLLVGHDRDSGANLVDWLRNPGRRHDDGLEPGLLGGGRCRLGGGLSGLG